MSFPANSLFGKCSKLLLIFVSVFSFPVGLGGQLYLLAAFALSVGDYIDGKSATVSGVILEANVIYPVNNISIFYP